MAITKTIGEKEIIETKIKVLQSNKKLWAGVLLFFGALFLYSAFPFYPIVIVPILALIVGYIAYNNPKLSVIVLYLLAFPSFSYQNPAWAWLYLPILSVVLFNLERWDLIVLTTIIISAPFAIFPISLISGLVYIAFIAGALYFGSEQSIYISIPSIILILLISASLGIVNNAHIPINLSLYERTDLLAFKQPINLENLPNIIDDIITNYTDYSKIVEFNQGLGILIDDLATLFFKDIGFLHIILWSAILYFIGYIPGITKKKAITKASLLIIIIPLSYYIFSYIFPIDFNWISFVYAALSVIVFALADYFEINISREREFRSKERLKMFGKFGVQDLSLSDVSLEDFGGYRDVIDELKKSIIEPLEHPEIAKLYGIEPINGVLLFGPPGTGKTMLMKALAKEMKYKFIYVKASDLLSQWYGESEKNLAELFDVARKNAPVILFFDEIENIGKSRELYTTDDVSPRLLTQFLQELDGANNNKGVIVVGATNVPDKLDKALLRPGRFDKLIYMRLPNKEERAEIFKVHLKKLPYKDIDFDRLAEKTERFSGADIAYVVEQAKQLAMERARKLKKPVPITMEDLEKVIANTRPSTSLSQLELYDKFKIQFERRTEKKEEQKSSDDWDKVVGLDDVKRAFLEAIELPLKHEDLMKEYGVEPSKGILMFGPPGCGKTMIVRAVSSKLNVTFVYLSGADLMKEGYAKALELIKEKFNFAKERTPAIIFIDEIDSIASARGNSTLELVSQLLIEMDGIKKMKGVVVVGATNRPNILDPALLRPGRFDKIFYVRPPNKKDREKLFEVYLGEFKQGINVKRLADMTPYFSGADIKSIVQEFKMVLLRAKLENIEVKNKQEILEKIIENRKPSITKDMLFIYEKFIEVFGERK